MAISQSNAKRVLAYSTVANLGLIVACCGVGTPEAAWAAVFLLIFHAAAKSLLFCCVGTAEHHLGSRDIEDMDAIFTRLPRLALLMALGMFCMFIAPFGMLVAKWATIVSMVNTGNVTLLLILAFGSALTFVFWAKWLGKVLAVAQGEKSTEQRIHRTEWFGLGLMAVLAVAMSVGFPWISTAVVEPYLVDVAATVLPDMTLWSSALSFAGTQAATGLVPAGSSSFFNPVGFNNLLIMSLIALFLIVAFVIRFTRKPPEPTDDIYLSGVGTDFKRRSFVNSLSAESVSTQRNWYLESWFGEGALTMFGNVLVIVVVAVGFIAVYLGIGAWI
jgi:ech hydrogenase subunit A